jgi:hypothetical protein
MSAVILTTDLLIFRNLKLVLGHRSMKIWWSWMKQLLIIKKY